MHWVTQQNAVFPPKTSYLTHLDTCTSESVPSSIATSESIKRHRLLMLNIYFELKILFHHFWLFFLCNVVVSGGCHWKPMESVYIEVMFAEG